MHNLLDKLKAFAIDVILFIWIVAVHLAIILILILTTYFIFN